MFNMFCQLKRNVLEIFGEHYICLICFTVPLRNKRTSHTQSIRAYAYGYTRIYDDTRIRV